MPIHSLQTLKGVFPSPQPPPKRDFLRENKLKLRELQKHTINYSNSCNNERQQHCSCSCSQYQLQQQQYQSNYNENESTNFKKLSLPSLSSIKHNKKSLKTNEKVPPNHYNTMNSKNAKRTNSGLSCSHHLSSARKTAQNSMFKTNTVNLTSSLSSSSTISSKKSTQSCDKEIQTDDISDEIFLSDALRRCISKETVQNMPSELPETNCDSLDHEDSHSIPPLSGNNHSSSKMPDIGNLHLNGLQDFDVHDKKLNTQASSVLENARKSVESKKSSGHQSERQQQQQKNVAVGQQISDTGSRGSRSNVRIPKYLEKEKREKELQKLREMQKDPMCPKGHYVLDEKEREETLNAAKKKFQSLVDELNRMPFTGETLRLRARKLEIEKSLSDLEKSIQIFSKPKVYVRIND